MLKQGQKRRRTECELLAIVSKLADGWTEGDRIMPHLRRLLPTIDRLIHVDDVAIADVALALDRAGINYRTGVPWDPRVLRKRLSEVRSAARQRSRLGAAKPNPKSRPALNNHPRPGTPGRPAMTNGTSNIGRQPSEPPPGQTQPVRNKPTAEDKPALADREAGVAEAPTDARMNVSPLRPPQSPSPTDLSAEGTDSYAPSGTANPMSLEPPVRRKARLASLKPPRGPASAPMRSYLEPGEPLPDWIFPPSVLAARKAAQATNGSAAAQRETDPDSADKDSLKENTL